jgi:hypothetical protein
MPETCIVLRTIQAEINLSKKEFVSSQKNKQFK